VVLEHFLTDTARYADYVFPAATQVEVLDLLTSWGQTYLALNKPAVQPAGEAVSNSEFFRRLAARMGLKESYLQESDEQIIRAALQSEHPFLQGITYERLEREGWVRLNIPEPWIPFAKGGFKTPSGKCEFYSQSLKDQGFDPVPTYDPVLAKMEGRYPLRLLTSKDSKYFVNSSNAGIKRLITENGEPAIKLHPDDAAKRKISSGDLVRVFNQRGEMKIKAAVTDSVIPGLLAVCHGWWGSRLPGGSSTNALTPDGLADRGEGGDFHDTWAEVEKV
jgi:anaerobic selenocysteine-containing dehydrogenase